jgi:hypothetical protein
MSTDTTNPTLTPEQKLKLLIANRPWETEPNNAEWEDKVTGYKCRITRHGDLGHLCGYVGIPKTHPLYGKHYSDDETSGIRAHGGLTYADSDEDWGGGLWWFGFDCSHSGDLSPWLLIVLAEKNRFDFGRHETYRTWEYVENEVRELVRQLRDEDALANQIPNLPIERG